MFVTFIVSMLLTLLIMFIEVKLTPERNESGEIDLRDKSVGIYFMLALVSSFLILPIYFYVRRGGAGAAIGLGLAVAVAILASMVSVMFQLALR